MPGVVPSSQAAGPRALGALAAQAPHAAPKAMAEVEVSCSALVTPRTVGVLFGCFGRKVDGDSWFTWFNNLPIYLMALVYLV